MTLQEAAAVRPDAFVMYEGALCQVEEVEHLLHLIPGAREGRPSHGILRHVLLTLRLPSGDTITAVEGEVFLYSHTEPILQAAERILRRQRKPRKD